MVSWGLLMDSNERYRLLVESVEDMAIYLVDAQGRIATWNRGAERLTGYSDEAIGMPASMLYVAGDATTALAEARTACREHGGSRLIEARLARKDGSTVLVSTTTRAVHDGSGAFIGFGETTRDRSRRMAADEAQRSTEEQFRRLVHGVVDYAIYMLDLEGHVHSWNAGARRIKGYEPEEIIGKHFSVFYTAADQLAGEPQRGLRNAREQGRFENQAWRVRKDGSLFWAHVVIDRIDDDEGQPIGFAKVTRDATESREAERLLDEMRRALHQSQKMEAIGHLTGGVAHDFNNLLQVISGNLQLLNEDVAGNDRAKRRIANAMSGVSRGSKLSSQLLSFARRQPLAPKVINPGRLIRGMDDLLRHTLGEEVEVETVIAGGLWNTLVDRANVENAILNLAINARDAMDGRGRLTIEAGNACLDDHYVQRHHDVNAGQYVLIAVTDTGRGIPTELLDKVFEPFFTTKSEGSGTGLGLSMVYGFVRQSGGHIKIYSEPGQGTTVRIYLPRSKEAEERLQEPAAEPMRGGTETILVVEDDEGVRDTAVSLLRKLGYSVLQASDAQSALSVIESGISLDLLFTDVVMPGPLRSPELAIKARERIPHLAVLFTSGYTANAIVHAGRLDEGLELLSKPYTHEAMARKVREVLDSSRAAAPPENPGSSHKGDARPTATPKPLRILLCEDDTFIRNTVRDILESKGHQVMDARTAEAAISLHAADPADLLLTDLNLPGASGARLAQTLRISHPGLPVLFITGRVTDDIQPDERTRVLIKPFGTENLTDAIASLMSVQGR
ncbi:PAS domain S-box-containing protein [Rhodanobacter sp. TND4EL1]